MTLFKESVSCIILNEMSRIQHLTKLFKAIASQDLTLADGVASQIAEEEEKKGHHAAAQLLRGSLHPNSRNGLHSSSVSPAKAEHIKTLSTALTLVNNPIRIKNVMLNQKTRKELSDVVKEWKYAKQLAEKKIRVRNRLFFYGPPGCGKSLTAQALGYEMSLPTYVVRFDAVIGAFLGQTALHLRELFRFTEETPCVLVFDEVDALAKQRGNPLDVGELDRIVISFMQELEHSQSKGIIVATSNLPNHLDKALWRRFDLSIEFEQPNPSDIRCFIQKKFEAFGVKLSLKKLEEFVKLESYAEAEKRVESVARQLAVKKLERRLWQKKKIK